MAGPDPRDPATATVREWYGADDLRSLDPEALRGARLGVLKNLLGQDPHVDAVIGPALEVLRARGAVLVDVELSSTAYEDAELEVLLYEFKADVDAYLEARGGPVRSVAGVIAFNARTREKEMPYFGQELLERAQAKGPLTDKAYLDALEKCRRLSRAEGIDAIVRNHDLAALVGPTGAPAWTTDLVNGDHYGLSCSTFAAVAGYPHVTVPAGTVFGLPVGLSFFGRAFTESRLLGFAHAFEQATRARRPPRFAVTAAV
jgi:amidase